MNILNFPQHTVANIRDLLAAEYRSIDRINDHTIELIGSSFVANEPTIFGEINQKYIDAEIEWYLKGSLCVYDIKHDPIPAIWKKIADSDGIINSNYGVLFLYEDNYRQLDMVIEAFKQDRSTRRAIAIYTSPSMHLDYKRNGMNDFVCTNSVQYFIRQGKLYAIVSMRSNDVVYGYRNDYAWQKHALNMVLERLKALPDFADIEEGEIIWQAASLHVYPRHYKLIHEYINGK